MRFPGFVGASYQLNSVNIDCQRCINLFPQANESGTAKEQEIASLVATPGLSLLCTLAGGVIRGLWTASNGTLYAVGGNKLYSLSSTFVATELGTLNTATGTVSISDNGLQLVIVDGSYGYVLTFSSLSFVVISDPNFPSATQVTFQDGYFIFIKPNSGQFFYSGLNSVTFSALDIQTSEGNPDNLVACLSDHRDLWMFNNRTIEVFFNSGNSLVFERIQGAFVEQGCAAAFSIAKMNNTVFWLGQDDKGCGMVFMAKGYQPVRISTHAIEQAIQSYGTISDAVAYTYQQDGHHFYVLNFSAANTTWVYDASTNLWHERVYNNNGSLERHRSNSHAFAYAKHVVGDYANGKIYELSTSVRTDNTVPIIRERTAPHLSAQGDYIFHQKLELDIETGVGLDGITQGTDPQVMMQFSNDGGHTWSRELWTSVGKIGETKRRAIWRRLGRARDRVYKIRITDPVKVTILGADLQVETGAS